MSLRAAAASDAVRRRNVAVAMLGGVERRQRSRSGADCRRASRTDRGSGSHPTSRPSSTRGGATDDVRMTASGEPSTSGAPSPGTRMIRSAKGTTRSSRCSAMTTVNPRSCTRRASVLEDLLGGRRIERGGGLVEDQQPW